MTWTRGTPLVGSVLVLVGAALVAQPPAAPAPRDPQRALTMSVADGLTLAAVGDCIMARPVSRRASRRQRAYRRLQRLSEPCGTRSAIEQGVGVIRPAADPPSHPAR